MNLYGEAEDDLPWVGRAALAVSVLSVAGGVLLTAAALALLGWVVRR